ncbi:MAG: lysophospholipid acyltransferase family protein [Ghiorsea sp.]|nr:lysophospholipid acyltransferase family protein [Ghiorsea sp.]
MLNVDEIIEERFPRFERNTSMIKRPVLAALRMLFHEREQQKFENEYPHLQGLDFVEQVLEYFDFGYAVQPRELERIPSSGRVVIIANHPIGTLDAFVLFQLVAQVRSDVKAVANQVLSSIKPLESLLLPVDNMGGQSTREQLKAVYQHLENEGVVIIFPAGEVSRLSPSGIRDGKWHSGFLRIASATHSPILPIHVNGRNSMFFYTLSLVAKPLSTLWLIREMFKQAKRSVGVSIGEIVPFDSYQDVKLPLQARVKLFQKHLYRIAKRKSGMYATTKPIARSEPRQKLRQEIHSCELLGKTKDGKSIYLATYQADSSLMREIGRLREIAFRAAGEGSGLRRDVDSFDPQCFQLVLWDDADLEIVGAYRMCAAAKVKQEGGKLYSETLFQFDEAMNEMMQQGLELGRSFVQPKYWGKRSLDYLWYGIGAFIRKNPEFRYLFGPVSISDNYPATAKDLLVYFYSLYFGDNDNKASALLPYRLHEERKEELAAFFSGENYKEDFKVLKSSLKYLGCAVPTLYKQYPDICEPEGVSFLGFNIDPDFANCVDGLVMIDLHQLKEKTRKRYIEVEQEPKQG